MELSITVADLGRRTSIVSVHGELDVTGADEFRAAQARCGGGRTPRRLVIDLSDATFLDSTGVALITDAAERAAYAARETTVVATDPHIIRMLRLTGLDRRIRVVGSLDEAVARPFVRPAVP